MIAGRLPEAELCQRFATDLAQAGWRAGERLGIAVSGGPDSLALLLLAHGALPGAIAAATVDHGLRPEAAEEARMVAQLCAGIGVPHRILRVTVAGAGNMQANARSVRYRALADWLDDADLAALAVAHHCDDQAETLLMRLARGAGVRGLAGMRVRGVVPGVPEWPLLRPLLGWRRAELEAIVTSAGIVAAQDSSNSDSRYLRVRLRNWLAAAPEGVDAVRIAAAAAHLGDADQALDWASDVEWERQVGRIGEALRYAPLAPRAVRMRVLARIIAEIGREGSLRGDELARLLGRLESGAVATLGGVRCDGSDPVWRFAPAPPHRKSA